MQFILFWKSDRDKKRFLFSFSRLLAMFKPPIAVDREKNIIKNEKKINVISVMWIKKFLFALLRMYFLLLPTLCLDALVKNRIEKNCHKKRIFTLLIHSVLSSISCYALWYRRAVSFSNMRSLIIYTFLGRLIGRRQLAVMAAGGGKKNKERIAERHHTYHIYIIHRPGFYVYVNRDNWSPMFM